MENLNNKENKIEIKPMGSYLEVDEEGYLKNPASLEKIQEKWKPVIDDVVQIYKNHFGEKLHSVYIRGSVAKGEAVDGVSDLDSFAYVDLPKEDIKKGWKNEEKELLKQKYPFVEDVEITVLPLSENGSSMILQSACVYGEKIKVPPKKPGREMFNHIYYLEERYGNSEKRLQETDPGQKEKIKGECTWLMKDILRAGFELTTERSGRYTRDLYLCYKDFSEYYPDKEPLMRQVLDLALNPVDDKEKILEMKNKIAPFIIEESKKFV